MYTSLHGNMNKSTNVLYTYIPCRSFSMTSVPCVTCRNKIFSKLRNKYHMKYCSISVIYFRLTLDTLY